MCDNSLSSLHHYPQTLKCLHGDLHGLPSARQLSRSVSQLSQLSTSQASTAGRAGGAVQAARSMAGCASLIPMVGWSPQGLISPQNGGPITHPLLPKRPGLADHQPIPCDSAHPPGGYTAGPASLIGPAAPIPPGICDFWPWVTLAAAGASLTKAALAG